MKYECRECDDNHCIIIIQEYTIFSVWICIVTPNSKKAFFKSIIEL